MAEPGATAELLAARPAFTRHVMDGLCFEGVPLAALAHAHGTPLWVTGAATLRHRAARLRTAMAGVDLHYAVKANDHIAVLAILARAGLGADVVSGGELRRALHAGIAPARIVFSGVGKTRAELAQALHAGIGLINVESPEELDALSAIATGMGATARIALRVNPDVDAGTHDKISTGRAGDKFGIALPHVAALYARAAAMPGIVPVGLAMHIGSQIFGMAAYRAAYGKLAALIAGMRADGLTVTHADCGGGLAIPYGIEPAPLPEAWAATIRNALGSMDLALSAEPGRWIAAPAGLLLARIIRTRRGGLARPIVILDAAMNDLARPALYDAWHGVVPVGAADLTAPPEIVDVAGPVCETSDVLARERKLPAMRDGALVAILDTGAYGAVMSSTYNARALAAHCLVDGGRVDGDTGAASGTLIRARGDDQEPWKDEMLPQDLA